MFPHKNIFTNSFGDTPNHGLLLVFRKLKMPKQKCSNTIKITIKRQSLEYDESGYTVKTYVKNEENLLSDAQKILTYKNVVFQNQCMLKTTNFQLRMSLQTL